MPVAADDSARSTPIVRIRKSPRETAGARSSAGRYEFSAPQFYDFNGPSPGVHPSETWFEKDHSPLHSATKGGTPERISGLVAKVPPTVTQNRRRLTDAQRADDGAEFKAKPAIDPPLSVGNSMLSPMVIAANKRSSNVFEEEPSHHATHSYERLFEMTARQPKAVTPVPPAEMAGPRKDQSECGAENASVPSRPPQLGKVRTPDKIKLARLNMVAPPLPMRSKQLTIPVEFKFSERTRTTRRGREETGGSSSKLSMADSRPVKTAAATAKRLTVPESPKLSTANRAKTPFVRPGERPRAGSHQMEDTRPRTNVSRVKTTTVPVGVKPVTGSRAQGRERPRATEISTSSTFRTTPLPESIGRLDNNKPPKLTVPVSPKLQTSTRTKAPTAVAATATKKAPPVFKARPVPHSRPFVPRVEHHTTRPLDISLPGEAIAIEKRRRFAEAIQKERQQTEEARRFQARPMPKHDPDHSAVSGVRPEIIAKARGGLPDTQ